MTRKSTLEEIAATIGLHIIHKPQTYYRGWPQPSKKPWGLYFPDGTLLAAFATLVQLERNLRGRAGC